MQPTPPAAVATAPANPANNDPNATQPNATQPAPAVPAQPVDPFTRLAALQPWGYIIIGTGYVVTLIFVGLLALVHDGQTINAALDLYKWVLTSSGVSISAWGAVHSYVNRPASK
jgi:hypothetical protein